MGWQGYDNEGCMPGDRERFLRLQEGMRRRNKPSSPSYTYDQLKQLMREFLDDMQHRGHVTTYGPDSLTDWKFETFLQWLAQQEQGKGGE